MGGRGTFAKGKSVPYRWVTFDTIGDFKVLQFAKGAKTTKLPEESHSPNAKYVRYDHDTGIFRMLRIYNENRLPVLEIAYGTHNGITGLHWHRLEEDVSGRGKAKGVDWDWIEPGDKYHNEYKDLIERVMPHGKK